MLRCGAVSLANLLLLGNSGGELPRAPGVAAGASWKESLAEAVELRVEAVALKRRLAALDAFVEDSAGSGFNDMKLGQSLIEQGAVSGIEVNAGEGSRLWRRLLALEGAVAEAGRGRFYGDVLVDDVVTSPPASTTSNEKVGVGTRGTSLAGSVDGQGYIMLENADSCRKCCLKGKHPISSWPNGTKKERTDGARDRPQDDALGNKNSGVSGGNKNVGGNNDSDVDSVADDARAVEQRVEEETIVGDSDEEEIDSSAHVGSADSSNVDISKDEWEAKQEIDEARGVGYSNNGHEGVDSTADVGGADGRTIDSSDDGTRTELQIQETVHVDDRGVGGGRGDGEAHRELRGQSIGTADLADISGGAASESRVDSKGMLSNSGKAKGKHAELQGKAKGKAMKKAQGKPSLGNGPAPTHTCIWSLKSNWKMTHHDSVFRLNGTVDQCKRACSAISGCRGFDLNGFTCYGKSVLSTDPLTNGIGADSWDHYDCKQKDFETPTSELAKIYAVAPNHQVYMKRLNRLQTSSVWTLLTNTRPVRAITIHDNLMYGISTDRRIFRFNLLTANRYGAWTFLSWGPPGGAIALATAGQTMYCINMAKKIYKHMLRRMNDPSSWKLASAEGSWISVMVNGDTIYAVGLDRVVYKQPLSGMKPHTKWMKASQPGVVQITCKNDEIYALGANRRIFKQQLSTMDPTTNWRLVQQAQSIRTWLSIAIPMGPEVECRQTCDSIFKPSSACRRHGGGACFCYGTYVHEGHEGGGCRYRAMGGSVASCENQCEDADYGGSIRTHDGYLVSDTKACKRGCRLYQSPTRLSDKATAMQIGDQDGLEFGMPEMKMTRTGMRCSSANWDKSVRSGTKEYNIPNCEAKCEISLSCAAVAYGRKEGAYGGLCVLCDSLGVKEDRNFNVYFPKGKYDATEFEKGLLADYEEELEGEKCPPEATNECKDVCSEDQCQHAPTNEIPEGETWIETKTKPTGCCANWAKPCSVCCKPQPETSRCKKFVKPPAAEASTASKESNESDGLPFRRNDREPSRRRQAGLHVRGRSLDETESREAVDNREVPHGDVRDRETFAEDEATARLLGIADDAGESRVLASVGGSESQHAAVAESNDASTVGVRHKQPGFRIAGRLGFRRGRHFMGKRARSLYNDTLTDWDDFGRWRGRYTPMLGGFTFEALPNSSISLTTDTPIKLGQDAMMVQFIKGLSSERDLPSQVWFVRKCIDPNGGLDNESSWSYHGPVNSDDVVAWVNSKGQTLECKGNNDQCLPAPFPPKKDQWGSVFRIVKVLRGGGKAQKGAPIKMNERVYFTRMTKGSWPNGERCIDCDTSKCFGTEKPFDEGVRFYVLKADYLLHGEGRCNKDEIENKTRLGSWVLGKTQAQAMTACNALPACKGYHWRVKDQSYVMVNRIGEIGKKTYMGDFCYRKVPRKQMLIKQLKRKLAEDLESAELRDESHDLIAMTDNAARGYIPGLHLVTEADRDV